MVFKESFTLLVATGRCNVKLRPMKLGLRTPNLKLIICYISSGATNISEVSSRFHQADWSTTLGIVYCYPISFLFWFICLLVYRNLILTINAQMKTSAQFKFELYITND